MLMYCKYKYPLKQNKPDILLSQHTQLRRPLYDAFKTQLSSDVLTNLENLNIVVTRYMPYTYHCFIYS